MDNQEPVTEIIKASEARRQWSALLNEVFRQDKRVVVEKSGVPVAAIISAKDLRRLERYDRDWDESFKILERAGEAFADVPLEELEAEVTRALREVREEQRIADCQRQEFAEVLGRMREAFKDIPPEEIEREVISAIAEVRAEYDHAGNKQSAS
ncbi:MAG: type II toxin-antitoxin system Phd/YefM family antitoxin [Chloroflexia bacterium]|jgi:prevent-host-death family protein|nr:type II toxin-antitoxin system Phd/YefM family antitoxin [Chloroflexia bacterium]